MDQQRKPWCYIGGRRRLRRTHNFSKLSSSISWCGPIGGVTMSDRGIICLIMTSRRHMSDVTCHTIWGGHFSATHLLVVITSLHLWTRLIRLRTCQPRLGCDASDMHMTYDDPRAYPTGRRRLPEIHEDSRKWQSKWRQELWQLYHIGIIVIWRDVLVRRNLRITTRSGEHSRVRPNAPDRSRVINGMGKGERSADLRWSSLLIRPDLGGPHHSRASRSIHREWPSHSGIFIHPTWRSNPFKTRFLDCEYFCSTCSLRSRHITFSHECWTIFAAKTSVKCTMTLQSSGAIYANVEMSEWCHP